MKRSIWNQYAVAWALLCCVLWGSATPFIKKGYEIFNIQSTDTASILLFAGMRFTLSGILVLFVARFLYKNDFKIKKGMGKAVMVLALFQTVGQYFFYYIGLANTSGVNGAIISGMSSYFSVLFACLVFRYEQLTFKKTLGCLLGFMGIVWMNHSGLEAHILGDSLVIISQVSGALSAVFIKKFTQTFHPVILSGCQFLLGGIVLCAIGLSLGGSLSAPIQGWLILLYLGCLSAVAYTIWGILLSKNPVSKITIFSCSIPIVGVLISAFLLKEYAQAFTVDTFIALSFVSVGIYTVITSKA